MNNVRIFQLCKLNCIERVENNLLKVLGSAWLQGLFIRKQSRLIISIFQTSETFDFSKHNKRLIQFTSIFNPLSCNVANYSAI